MKAAHGTAAEPRKVEGIEMTQAGETSANAVGRFAGLLETSAVVGPDAAAAAAALIPDYQAAYDRAAHDPEGFWSEIAAGLEWARPWSQVLDWQPPYARWFVGAQCNITI